MRLGARDPRILFLEQGELGHDGSEVEETDQQDAAARREEAAMLMGQLQQVKARHIRASRHVVRLVIVSMGGR
jgi:hypothetical protein